MESLNAVLALLRPMMLLKAAGLSLFLLFIHLLVDMIRARLKFRRLAREYDIPMMEHSWIFGHLLTIGKVVGKAVANGRMPPDLSSGDHIDFLLQTYPDLREHGLLFMDIWPMTWPFVAVCHPDMEAQVTQKPSLPKWWAQGQQSFYPVTKGLDILNASGLRWKKARAMFNPGFSAQNLLALTPHFVEEMENFQMLLRRAADSQETVEIENMTVMLAVDLTQRAVTGLRTQCQVLDTPNSVFYYVQKQTSLVMFQLDLRKQLDPVRPFRQWYYRRQIQRLLTAQIQAALQDFDKLEGPKTVLGLALQAEMKEQRGSSGNGELSQDFVQDLVHHLTMFIIAGHDTTSVAMANCCYHLFLHPKMADRMRREHDEVFGDDPEQVSQLVSRTPSLLNQLPFTHAFCKEILRLHPPVGGSNRQAEDDNTVLVHPQTGKIYPVAGFQIHACASASQRNPLVWAKAAEFIPDRWLIRDQQDPLYPPKNGFRTFSPGTRNCIGQEMVWIVMKLILAMTCRSFDFVPQYAPDAPEYQGLKGYHYRGNRDQPISTHIKDYLPCKIQLRKR